MDRDFNNDIMEGGVAIDSAVKDFNKILYTACSKSLRLSNKHRGQNGHKKNKPKHWFDQDLAVQRREMIRKSELYSKYPNDPIVKGNFFRFRKMYSKCCKRKYREFKASIIDKLDQLHDNDPNMYWSLLRKLKEDCNKSDPSEQITSGEWVNYFQNLFSLRGNIKNQSELYKNILQNSNFGSTFNELDYRFTNDEVAAGIKTLKNKKAAGLDHIKNEMLKHSSSFTISCIVKLFNLILSNGYYPLEWRKGYIRPIFKGGDKMTTQITEE